LQEILACTGVQTSKKKAQLAKKIKKTPESSGPIVTKPNPRTLMGPDQPNASGTLDWSRSIWILIKRLRAQGAGSGQSPPGPALI